MTHSRFRLKQTKQFPCPLSAKPWAFHLKLCLVWTKTNVHYTKAHVPFKFTPLGANSVLKDPTTKEVWVRVDEYNSALPLDAADVEVSPIFSLFF